MDGVINVHYVVDAGFAGVFRNGISKDGIIMNFSAMSTSTLAHEVGHYFGLAHTHRNSDSDSECKQESVSRTREIKFPCCISNCINCEKKGDALCDTPADPNLNDGSFTTLCNYSDITATDLWGDFYSTNPPDTRNIMSYMNPRVCRDNFTNNQILAMIDKLLKRGYGHDNEDPIEKYFFDKYEPDDNAIRAKPIYRNIKQHHTSHWSRINDNEVNACDVDWFIFTVAPEDEGIPLLIETNAGIFNDANTEVFVYLNGFGSSSQVGFDFNTENYSNVVLNYPLPGIYYIEVRFINEPPANSILDYNIELSECTLSKPCVNGIVKSGETKYFYGVEAVTIPCRGGSFLVESGGKAIIISEQLVNLREDIIVEDGGIIESVIMEIENPCGE